MKTFLLTLASIFFFANASWSLEFDVPATALQSIPFSVTVSDLDGEYPDNSEFVVRNGGAETTMLLSDGTGQTSITLFGGSTNTIELVAPNGTVLATSKVWAMPGWISLVPALIAIAVALATRMAIPALFLGLWIGAAFLNGPHVSSVWSGLLDTIPVYVVGGLNDTSHLSVVVFTLMIGGMVGIISKNGGTAGIVQYIVRGAASPRSAQTATGGLGLAIFFDDYANTMIVGTTMRPVTDRLKVSREKLAYLVDSTAAPVATLALVTTWVGFVVSVISESLAGLPGFEESGYGVYLASLQFSFYQILSIVFVFIVALSGRDFGPMLAAERRARQLGLLSREGARMGETPAEEEERAPKPESPQRAVNAVVPIIVMVFGTLAGLYSTGRAEMGAGASLLDIIGEGDPFASMVWASLMAVLVAVILSISQRILSFQETMDAWFVGARSMLLTIMILSLAWALADVNGDLGTGPYLTSALGGRLSPDVIPALVFVVAATTAFATGSSWGVMGIVMPLAVPLIWSMVSDAALTGYSAHLIAATVAAVIGGAVWGDHCSPISDTTILSSIASGCDHIDHVRSQLPYAVLVGALAVLSLYLSVKFALPWWSILFAATGCLLCWMFIVGKPSDQSGAKR